MSIVKITQNTGLFTRIFFGLVFFNEISCVPRGILVCADNKAVTERHNPLATAKFDPARTMPPAKQGTFEKREIDADDANF